MCLLSSVALRFDSILNEALWLAYLDLKLVAVNPTYVSTLLPQVTVARYTIIEGNNKKILRNSEDPITEMKCSCPKNATCPLDGECLASDIDLRQKILCKPENATLNKRNELVSKCRHKDKFLLSNVA